MQQQSHYQHEDEADTQSQYFKHPICVGEYGPKNGAERQIEEQKVLPTTMMFSRLADCALKSTQIPILGVAV
uniref:Uncharacterized protein n=1 Tax=Macaca fascicularis TaxID=9541 RepID=A0A7N9CBP2_MACFA